MLLVIAVSALPLFIGACGDTATTTSENNNQNANNDNNDVDDPDTPASDSDNREQHNPNFEPVDMQGYVFQIGTRDDDAPYHPYPVHTRDLFAEAENGDLINDATYRRNRLIEDKYNCTIEMLSYQETAGEAQANTVVERNVKAGDKSYDLLMTHMMIGVDSAARGVFHDIAAFPNIDLTKPYWIKGANEGCSIGNKLFYGLSELSFSTNENLYCIFFNKDHLRDYGVEDPYKLIKENQWTLDKFSDLIKVGTVDLNGDGKMDENDQYGYISTAAVNFLWSCGSHMMKKDEFDIPVVDFINERTLTIYDKVFDIVNNENTYSKEMWWFTGPTIGGITMFANGQGVFYGNQLCRVNELRSAEFDFGIVPYPKFDAAQEKYYAYVDGHASMMAIPLLLPNPEWTGIIIEELSFLSYRDILPVYYGVVFEHKLIRDEESIEMLKILFDGKVFDPAYVMTGGFTGLWAESISGKKRDFVSAYEKQERSVVSAIQKKIDALLELDQ